MSSYGEDSGNNDDGVGHSKTVIDVVTGNGGVDPSQNVEMGMNLNLNKYYQFYVPMAGASIPSVPSVPSVPIPMPHGFSHTAPVTVHGTENPIGYGDFFNSAREVEPVAERRKRSYTHKKYLDNLSISSGLNAVHFNVDPIQNQQELFANVGHDHWPKIAVDSQAIPYGSTQTSGQSLNSRGLTKYELSLVEAAVKSISQGIEIEEFSNNLKITRKYLNKLDNETSSKKNPETETNKNIFVLRCLFQVMNPVDVNHTTSSSSITNASGITGSELAKSSNKNREMQYSMMATPRSLVYAAYQMLCEKANVEPIGQSGLGKLLKIAFPTVATKRLGVRGYSKYHYVGITLKPELKEMVMNYVREHEHERENEKEQEHVHEHEAQQKKNSTDSPQISVSSTQAKNSIITPATLPQYKDQQIFKFFNQELQNNQRSLENYLARPRASTIYPTLCFDQSAIFANPNNGSLSMNEPLVASLNDYLLNSDLDGAIKHVTSIEDLTILKDLYKNSLIFLSPLSYKGGDELILNNLTNISDNFLNNYTSMVTKSKEIDLTCFFINILKRIIICSRTSLSTSKILIEENYQMLKEFESLELDSIVCFEIDGVSERLKAFEILSSLKNFLNSITETVQLAQNATNFSSDMKLSVEFNIQESLVMENFVSFLKNLETSFGKTSIKTLLLFTEKIITRVLNELYKNNSNIFAKWWVISCWINEWLGYRGEMAGFKILQITY